VGIQPWISEKNCDPRTREPSEPQTLETVVGFRVGEAHLETLSFVRDVLTGEYPGHEAQPVRPIVGARVEIAPSTAGEN
jgi:hypothetical protein